MYQHGVNVVDMRISNLHHETAIQVLLLVQEIEPATWNKVANRIDGASSIKHIKKNSFACPKELPYMFKDWEDYAYHLANNIIQDEENKKLFLNKLDSKKLIYTGDNIKESFWKVVINTILSSDWDFTKIANYEMSPQNMNYRNFKKGRIDKDFLNHHTQYLKVFTKEEINQIKEIINGQG